MKLLNTVPLFFILLFVSSPLLAQSAPAPSPAQPCASFVQQFYDWYVGQEKASMNKKMKETPFEFVLREKKSFFSPELLQALKDDLEASKKSPGEIVGLDFDPFLNAQDVADRYLVGKITPKGGHYWVDVLGIWGGKKSSKPDVTPELILQGSQCVFTNFHYGTSGGPANENLLSILQQLKKDRKK